MEAIINIKGIIGEEATVEGLVTQVKQNKDAEKLVFVIDSIGGNISEGMAMGAYMESLDIPTKTIAKKVYSIAVIPFLSSEEREAEKDADFMLHMAWIEGATGNKDDMKFLSEYLDNKDSIIRNYISDRTSLKDGDLKALMSKDTYINSIQAKELGFFDSKKQLKLVALANKPNKEMSKVDELIKEIKNALIPSKKPEVKNMDIELEDGENIFVESEDGELEGKTTSAPAGTHRLKDGRTITVVEGEDGNIVESVSEDSPETEAMEEDEEKKMLAKENEELKAKVEELEAKALAQKTENEKKLKEVENDLNFIKKNLKSQEVPAGKQPTYSNDSNNNPDSAFTAKLLPSEKLMLELKDKNKK